MQRTVSRWGMLAVLAATQSVSAAITDNLVGNYTLDETDSGSTTVINSAPGATENGIRSAGTVVNQPGEINGAYHTGDDTGASHKTDQILFGTSAANQLLTTDKLTLSAWVNPTFYRPGTNAASRHTIFGSNVALQFSL
jgi:hypothetical protein